MKLFLVEFVNPKIQTVSVVFKSSDEALRGAQEIMRRRYKGVFFKPQDVKFTQFDYNLGEDEKTEEKTVGGTQSNTKQYKK